MNRPSFCRQRVPTAQPVFFFVAKYTFWKYPTGKYTFNDILSKITLPENTLSKSTLSGNILLMNKILEKSYIWSPWPSVCMCQCVKHKKTHTNLLTHRGGGRDATAWTQSGIEMGNCRAKKAQKFALLFNSIILVLCKCCNPHDISTLKADLIKCNNSYCRRAGSVDW